jgi:hypothetical protein
VFINSRLRVGQPNSVTFTYFCSSCTTVDTDSNDQFSQYLMLANWQVWQSQGFKQSRQVAGLLFTHTPNVYLLPIPFLFPSFITASFLSTLRTVRTHNITSVLFILAPVLVCIHPLVNWYRLRNFLLTVNRSSRWGRFCFEHLIYSCFFLFLTKQPVISCRAHTIMLSSKRF